MTPRAGHSLVQQSFSPRSRADLPRAGGGFVLTAACLKWPPESGRCFPNDMTEQRKKLIWRRSPFVVNGLTNPRKAVLPAASAPRPSVHVSYWREGRALSRRRRCLAVDPGKGARRRLDTRETRIRLDRGLRQRCPVT